MRAALSNQHPVTHGSGLYAGDYFEVVFSPTGIQWSQ